MKVCIDGAVRVGAHRTSKLQDVQRGRTEPTPPWRRTAKRSGSWVLKTAYIDAVLALTQQMGEVAGGYPAFPVSIQQPDAVAAAASGGA